MNLRAFIYRNAFPLAKIYWRIFKPKSEGSGCVIEHDGKILLIRQTYGRSDLWSFPGGSRNGKESPEETAIREAREEVGVDILNIQNIGSFVCTSNHREDTVHAFKGIAKNGDIKIDPGEIAEAKWFPKDDVPKLSYVGKRIYELYKNSA